MLFQVFDYPEFQEHGYLLWPDFWRTADTAENDQARWTLELCILFPKARASPTPAPRYIILSQSRLLLTAMAMRGLIGTQQSTPQWIDLAVLTLKEEQDLLYYGFLGSLILYFCSAVVMVFVYKSHVLANLGTAFVLGLFLTIFMYHWYTVES